MVTSGTIPRTAKVRLLRDGQTVWTGRIGSLKRFKDDVREVQTAGSSAASRLDGMNDVKVGDVIEAFTIEELARTLVAAARRSSAAFEGTLDVRRHRPHRAPPAGSTRRSRTSAPSCEALKDRIRERVHAAVAEIDHQDLWQRAALGVAVVSGESRQVRRAACRSVRTPGRRRAWTRSCIDWQEQRA